jgi:MFS superfamily sulfate permease-like transporter
MLKQFVLSLKVRTPFGGVVTGLIILLACAMLSPYLAYIPTSVLSAVIIFSMFSTIAYKLPLQLWRSQSEYSCFVNHLHYVFHHHLQASASTLALSA